MYSHVTFGTNDLGRCATFYDPLMVRLGFRRIDSDPSHGLIGYGTAWDQTPQFYLMKPYNGEAATVGNGAMAAFEAQDHATVDDFHRIAMEQGGSCEGPPGLRQHYHPDYYGAYVRDPDGNKLCCVCHRPA